MEQTRYSLRRRHATWLELFFDLVFVASIGIVTHNLAHTHDGHIATTQLLFFPVEFIPIWWIWATHTLFANRFDDDSARYRIASLAIMLLLVSMSSFLGNSLFAHYERFILFYISIRMILAALFFFSLGSYHNDRVYARGMGLCILIGALVAGLSFFLEGPTRIIVFLSGILIEMLADLVIGTRSGAAPIHQSHMVERIGLLTIILLGESIISLVSGLRSIDWNAYSITASIAGFMLIGCIWWIYFDTFDLLERAKGVNHGFALLYPHILLSMGLVILANLIRHAIISDLEKDQFQLLAIIGMTLFYIGKQTSYFLLFPVYRINITINSLACIGMTIISTFLSRPELTLVGMMLAMLVYVYLTILWTLPKDASQYIIDDD